MASVCLPCNLRYWLICFLNYNSCPRDGGIRKTLQPLCHPSNEIVGQFSFHVGPEPRVSWVQSPSHCIMGVRSARRARLRAVVLWQYCTESVLSGALGSANAAPAQPGVELNTFLRSWELFWAELDLMKLMPCVYASSKICFETTFNLGGRQGRKDVATH